MNPSVLSPLRDLSHKPLDAVGGVRYPHPFQGKLCEGDHEPCVLLYEGRGFRVASQPPSFVVELLEILLYPELEPLIIPVFEVLLRRVYKGGEVFYDGSSGLILSSLLMPSLQRTKRRCFMAWSTQSCCLSALTAPISPGSSSETSAYASVRPVVVNTKADEAASIRDEALGHCSSPCWP